ncbi:unnamed protein product [Alternaria alternata]
MKLSNTLKRLMPLLLAALSLALAFGTAGVFSSRISSSMGDEVILSSSSCGYLWWDSGFDTADVDALINYSNRLTVEAADYSRNCYRSDAVATDCPTYTRKSLPMDVVDNATCPFDPKVCLLDGDNLVIDTGRINSHSDLGINAEPRDRFDYRRVTSCAPLRTEGYSESVNKTIEGYQVPFTSYLYGKNLHNDANYTYDYSTFRTSLDAKNAADYTLMPIRFYAQNWGDFDPIPELNQTNDEADLTLLALSTNDVIFEQLVTDPWYSATTEVESQEAGQALRYFSDHPASFVGCKVQHQWCEPNENRCTQLAAFNKVALEAQTLSYSAVQNASVYAMTWALNMAPSIETIVDRLGVSALTSRYTLNYGIQGPLSTNQWQTEIQHLHSTSLAALQRMTVEQASGPNDRSVKRFFIPPDNDMERKARCQQKVRSKGYTSFSVLGLGLVVGLGTVVAIISYSIETLAECVQNWRNLDPYHQLEWTLNGTLQLQRLAHEELGYGTWENGDAFVPLTGGDERLAMVDCVNVKHPCLQPLQMVECHEDSKTTEETKQSNNAENDNSDEQSNNAEHSDISEA